MFEKLPRLFSSPATFTVLLGAATIVTTGAAGLHRLAATQGTGSNGSESALNSSVSGSAFEGNVGAADTSYATPFGLFGVYNNNTSQTFGIGVLGASTTGYGVAAEGLSNQPSILAYPGGNGDGIESTTAQNSVGDSIYSEAKGSGNGITAVADGAGDGAQVSSKTGIGLSATSSSNDAATFTGKGQAFVGLANGGALAGYGTSGSATSPVISAQANVTGTDLFAAYNYSGVNGNTSTSAGSSLKTAFISGESLNRGGGGIPGASDLQISGDIFVYGQVFQECSNFPVTSSSGCSAVPIQESTTTITSPSRHGDVAMYSARQTLPSVEDFGTGRLAGGRAYVSLDPTFADTISRTQPYMVIVTPGGESHGVYVSNRTLSGFEVHENDAGRSTIDFDYRIVARPIGDNSVRLAAVARRQKFGASRAAFSPPDRLAMSRPLIRRPPAIDPSFVRASATLERQR